MEDSQTNCGAGGPLVDVGLRDKKRRGGRSARTSGRVQCDTEELIDMYRDLDNNGAGSVCGLPREKSADRAANYDKGAQCE